MSDLFKNSFEQLKSFCEKNEFKGWDPYDGLNSKIFNATTIRNSRLARLIWIQFFKRSPFNFRKIALIDKGYNPQGLGLFLSGYCNLYKIDPKEEYLEKITFLAKKILELKTDGYSGACWGYNFEWQARAFHQPKFSPTVVATTFVCYGLLDAYDITKDENLLKAARSACDFVLKDLNRTYDNEGNFAFSYSPLDNTQVFNASLLGSRLLARVYSYTKENELIEEAKKSVQFCCNHQQVNGAWSYGTRPYHHWIDSFHTGYNLECISEYQNFSGDTSFQEYLNKGLSYYLKNHFLEDGTPKYYDNKIYPIDINCPAQLVVTLYRLGKLNENFELVNKVLIWTIKNMQDSKGFFYYQKKKGISSKIPYMRWAQAWMFNTLTFYFRHQSNNE